MTLQDLKNNRNRIIRSIDNGADVKKVMNQMVIWVENAPEYIKAKPLMKNIDKLVREACENYWKYDYTPTQEAIDATLAEGKRQQMLAL